MFTGIIEERGKINNIEKSGTTLRLTIEANKVLENTKVGDSIAVNGMCLTVVEKMKNIFFADVSEETFKVTTVKNFKRGMVVNLERALALGDRLSGHIVTGHIDTCGQVIEKYGTDKFFVVKILFDRKFSKYVIPKGSIAVDGISLTINEVKNDVIRLNIIPHTLKNTNLEFLSVGDMVNLEFDIIGKYVERILIFNNENSKVSEELLYKAGFMEVL